MTLFKHKHYVPVLKGKRAEFPALEALDSFDGLTPVFECVPAAPPDFIPRKLAGFWPKASPYFIDALFVDDADAAESEAAEHPIAKCFAEAKSKKQTAIPVTGIERSPAYQAAVAKIAREHKTGVAVRLIQEDFEDEAELGLALSKLTAYLGVKVTDIDILIDSDSVAESTTGSLTQTLRSNIELLPTLNKWRTLVTIAGAFPKSLAPLTKGDWNTVPRVDWAAWNQLCTGGRRPSRLPTYGDYAIAHPDMPPRGRATILGQLRYTTPSKFLIWKGHNVFTHSKGYDQFIDICKDMVGRPEYRGPTFSAGDDEISVKATIADSPGNAETWRKIGTNHHLQTVLEQIANLP